MVRGIGANPFGWCMAPSIVVVDAAPNLDVNIVCLASTISAIKYEFIRICRSDGCPASSSRIYGLNLRTLGIRKRMYTGPWYCNTALF